ncbi:hypothetical protein AB9M75_04005 [Lactobacillus sp. AN1001]
MKKIIILKDDVKDNNGVVVAELTTYLEGDGSTPIVQTVGGESTVVGYNDDGTVILSQDTDRLINNARQKFMAQAIKYQKELCIENGVDPELVNIINAERK